MNPNFLDPDKVKLDNLAGGAAIERFDFELERTLTNVLDPNMDAKKKRVITLKVTLQPSVDRDYATIEIECSSSLAPVSAMSSHIYIGRDIEGKPFAQQNNMKQSTFADLQKDKTNVTQISKVK